MELHASDPPSPSIVGLDGLTGVPPPIAAPESAGADPASTPAAEAEAPAAPPSRKRRRRSRRWDAPSWAVSLVVHVAVLTALGLATFSNEVKKAVASINSALVSTSGRSDELTPIYADPGDRRSDQSVGSEGAPTGGDVSRGEGGGSFGGIGTGPPSASPKVAGVGKGLGNGNGAAGIKVAVNTSGLSLMPSATKLGVDLGGGGMIGGDVTYEAADVGVALDQIAREILRHLGQHKLTVVWLFDESGSMKDDQKAIRSKFDRVATELKVNLDEGQKRAAALNHAIVGFGAAIHYDLPKPTLDIDAIGHAIDRLKIDDTGVENTMHAIRDVIGTYTNVIGKDRRLLIVLVTDESGDDGDFVEEAHQAAVSMKVPIYVIGRQSLFGLSFAHLLYVDPVTKEHFYPAIRRGPETADLEVLQWDGLRDRRDEQPSGFAPYELARLAKDTGGIYFLLPSEESMRIHRREKAYSIKSMKEYLPDYGPRAEYVARRDRSDLRRSLHEVIATIKSTSYKLGFSIFPDQLVPEAAEAIATSTLRLNILLTMQRRLEQLQPARDREPDRRWQAHYDLMLAQVVAYQVKAFEYRACLEELARLKPRPKQMPSPTLNVWWELGHSRTPKAPRDQTAKKYAEAEALFRRVIARHPNTPWSDMAQDELDRGFSVTRWEAHHTPRPPGAPDRSKFVPKY